MANKFMLQAILSAVDKISPSLKNVRRGLRLTQKSFRDLGGAARGIIGGVGLAGVLSFSALGFGALNAAHGALQYAGAMNDARDATGIALQPLQELQGMFEMGGVSSEEFLSSVTKLSKGMADAGAGKDDGLLGLLNQLRIPLRDVNGQIRSVDDVLPELADAFKANENPAIRARIATELFGKAGTKMISVLQEGAESMKAARAEARRLGTVLSDEAATKVDELGDGFDIVGRQLRVQFAESFGLAAPAIMSAVKGIQEWIAANKEMLQIKIGGYLTKIAQAFQAWVESGGIERLGTGILRLVDGVTGFVDAMGGMENVLIGVGLLMVAGPAASAVQLGAILLRLGTSVLPLLGRALMLVGQSILFVGRMIMANPIGLAVTAIAAGVYLIYRNWGAVGPWFKSMWESVKGIFSAGVNALLSLFLNFTPLGQVIKNWEPIVSWFSGMWDRVKKFIQPIMAGARAIGGLFGRADMSPVAAGGRMLNAAPAATRGGSGPGAITAAPSSRLNGDLRVRFENAPQGMRVDPGKSNQPGLAINPDVGYRNSVMG